MLRFSFFFSPSMSVCFLSILVLKVFLSPPAAYGESSLLVLHAGVGFLSFFATQDLSGRQEKGETEHTLAAPASHDFTTNDSKKIRRGTEMSGFVSPGFQRASGSPLGHHLPAQFLLLRQLHPYRHAGYVAARLLGHPARGSVSCFDPSAILNTDSLKLKVGFCV